MRFLDIDLDFFLNRNAYYSGDDSKRLGEDHKPWSFDRVRCFLETRCGLAQDAPVPGRVIESHDLVIRFWQDLIESGNLQVPFDVVHVDAHPDLSVRGGLYLVSGALFVDLSNSQEMFEDEYVHSGNYLTFAIARGWIASLVWVPLRPPITGPSTGYPDAFRPSFKGRQPERVGVPFKVVSRRNFKTRKPFDYMILSRSPAFTPILSDALVPVISEYMKIV